MIVDSSGLVVTNYHVIEGMTEVKVALSDKREFEAQIVLRDPRTDLAVLRLKGGGNFPVLELGDSDALEVGDFVIAIGDPFGVGQTVTKASFRRLRAPRSGSATTASSSRPSRHQSRQFRRGAGRSRRQAGRHQFRDLFALGRQHGDRLRHSRQHGQERHRRGAPRRRDRQRPWLGATLQSLTKDIADNLGIDRPTGALVVTVAGEGPAFDAGLKRGDVITAVDGQSVEDAESVGFRLAVKPLGGAARSRSCAGAHLEPAAQTRRGAGKSPARRSDHPQPLALPGGRSHEHVARGRRGVSLEGAAEGVVVASVGDGSTAAEVGVQKGDVVVAVNGQKIGTTRDLEKACAERARLWI